ncbi:transposase [Streptomyces sp. NPDC059396]|uniref:transposase n=1 Tax=Streptomyces sp. NPDC059396 TaxID=3346819 RepID=UPI0036D1D135
MTTRPRVPRRRGRPRTRPDAVIADKAYSSRAIRNHLRKHGIHAVIPVPADQRGHRLHRGSRGGRATGLRPRDVQAAQHRRTVHEPPEAMAWPRHPLREDRDHLPGRTPHLRAPNGMIFNDCGGHISRRRHQLPHAATDGMERVR